MDVVNKSEALLSVLREGQVRTAGNETVLNDGAGQSSTPTDPQTLDIIDDTDGKLDDSDVYYFESDHLALKGNKDYQNLLRTIALLEAQRTKAIKDIDTLNTCKQEALADPIKFVQKLQNGMDIGIPAPQQIAKLPFIHWENYTSGLGNITINKHKHMTRNKKSETNTEPDPTAKGR